MPVSLNLPFSVCYPLTLLARRIRTPVVPPTSQDQDKYFAEQSESTKRYYQSLMAPLDLCGKRILDIGCGLGGRAIGWLELGAESVLNIDINRQELIAGEQSFRQRHPSLIDRVQFKHPDDVEMNDCGNLAILFDSFEHLTDPAAVLRFTHSLLLPQGQVWIGSIGWYNHMASHCTGTHIPIPWCQLFFSEHAILKTIQTLLRRADYEPNLWERQEGLDRWDAVTTLKDRPGEPLNMLSLRQVRKVLRQSPFELLDFDVRGFGGKAHSLARLFASLAKVPVLDEVLHSYYAATLAKR